MFHRETWNQEQRMSKALCTKVVLKIAVLVLSLLGVVYPFQRATAAISRVKFIEDLAANEALALKKMSETVVRLADFTSELKRLSRFVLDEKLGIELRLRSALSLATLCHRAGPGLDCNGPITDLLHSLKLQQDSYLVSFLMARAPNFKSTGPALALTQY